MSTVQQELERLQQRIIDAKIPTDSTDNFRLLTWNIRNFNGEKEDRAVTS